MNLARLLQLAGKKTPRKRERRARPTKPSRKAEANYRDDLLQIVREIERVTRAYLLPVLQRTEPQYTRTPTTKDSSTVRDGFAFDILAAFEQMAQALGGIDRMAARWAQIAVARQAEETDRQLSLGLAKSLNLGIDITTAIRALNVQPQIEAATVANTQLIKSIKGQSLERMQRLVLNGATSGRRYEALAKDIEAEFGVTERRAKLIARDQMAKVNSTITEAKQTALGITEYEWVTAGDERVREDHRANNGKVFKWSDPPATGHPGDDINCRCIAKPIIKFEE